MATVRQLRKRLQATIQGMYSPLDPEDRPSGPEFLAARIVTEKVLDYLEASEGRANIAYMSRHYEDWSSMDRREAMAATVLAETREWLWGPEMAAWCDDCGVNPDWIRMLTRNLEKEIRDNRTRSPERVEALGDL